MFNSGWICGWCNISLLTKPRVGVGGGGGGVLYKGDGVMVGKLEAPKRYQLQNVLSWACLAYTNALALYERLNDFIIIYFCLFATHHGSLHTYVTIYTFDLLLQ